MKRSSATFELYRTGMLITAVSLVSNSFQGILIILEVLKKCSLKRLMIQQ
jgi:hypothetical protein